MERGLFAPDLAIRPRLKAIRRESRVPQDARNFNR